MDQKQQFLCRRLEQNDYHKGFLKCLSYLTSTPDITFEKFNEIFLKYPGIVFVIEDVQQNIITSSMSVVIENNIFESKYYIENVVTLPEYRGKGFVKLLLDKVKTEIPGVNLELYCINEMVGFYGKMGFTSNGVVASKYL